MSGRRFGWVLGWAIPAGWFEAIVRGALPNDAHVLVEPSASSWMELEAAEPFDGVVGYSLGTLLLLQDPERAERLVAGGTRKRSDPAYSESPLHHADRFSGIALLAPVWGFTREAGCGGKIPRANLRALGRAYRANPETALKSFYRIAGISGGSGAHAVPERSRRAAAFASSDLTVRQQTHLWGLEQLDRVSVPPLLPSSWRAWCGSEDPLLDAHRIQSLVPALQIIPTATHHPEDLIPAFAASVS